jgi:hypothetical protein
MLHWVTRISADFQTLAAATWNMECNMDGDFGCRCSALYARSMRSGDITWLPRDERRERPGCCCSPKPPRPRCAVPCCRNSGNIRLPSLGNFRDITRLYCLGPLPNGSPACSLECDSGWWEFVPTIDGELYFSEQRHDRGEQDQTQYDRQAEPALVKRLARRQELRQSPPA